MNNQDVVRGLKLSLQRALLGAVTSNLFAVSAGVFGNTIRLIFYYLKPPSPSEIADASDVEGEILGDFPDDFRVNYSLVVMQGEELENIGFWVYMRKRIQ